MRGPVNTVMGEILLRLGSSNQDGGLSGQYCYKEADMFRIVVQTAGVTQGMETQMGGLWTGEQVQRQKGILGRRGSRCY